MNTNWFVGFIVVICEQGRRLQGRLILELECVVGLREGACEEEQIEEEDGERPTDLKD